MLVVSAVTDSLHEQARRHLLLHFTRHGAIGAHGENLLVLERGEGAYVFDTEGNRYLDGLSSLFCCQIGYSHGEEMAAAASAQLSRLAFNTNWATAHPPAIELAAALAERAPGDVNRVFFTNGGSEAVEAAWKLVRQYHVARGEPQRTKAIARDVAYHGVTLGALSFTGVAPMKEQFGPPPVPVVRVSNTNSFRDGAPDLLDELERTIEEAGPDTIAMVIMEPVQNAGGCLVPPDGYWAGVRELCDRHGIVLVADEVITGFGRIDGWFAAPSFGATPDIITVAKGITSAYAPMGAVLVSDRIAEPLYEDKRMLLHGITYGGHPVAAAVALKNLEIFEREGVLDNVRRYEPWLREKLEGVKARVPIVGDVRGAGFFWALELVRDAENTRFDAEERERMLRGFFPRRLLDEGLIARPDDRGDAVLHLAPPLVCGEAELQELVDKAEAVLADASERFYAG
jgi:adenosylmethionine-8-amino-7-oxononanoate aminotransferase